MRNFVHNLLGEPLFEGDWIGMTDRQTPGKWLTWDGKEPPFLYWGKGQPKEQGGNCCAVDRDNMMFNMKCERPEMVLCQIKTDTLIKMEAEKYSTELSNFLSEFQDKKTGQ